MYLSFVKQKFGNAAIVFYLTESPTKYDESWLRETKGALGIEVAFTLESELNMKKETFLRSKRNRQKFITLLEKKLQYDGLSVHMNVEEFSVLIAKVAIQYSKTRSTVVVGGNVDLIMVLCFNISPDSLQGNFSTRNRLKTISSIRYCWDEESIR